MRNAILLAAIVTLIPGASWRARADETASGLQSKTFQASVPVELDYLLALPDGYEAQEKWPLLIFLHGAGERGDDLTLLERHGPPMQVAAGRKLPFIMIAPQCPTFQFWEIRSLNALLDDVIARHKVDVDRVYLAGISMGGMGAWEWAGRHPERFAALVPICGRGDRTAASRIAPISTWVFHGMKDDLVPISHSETMVGALQAEHAEPRFTIYPDEAHESWKKAFEDPDLYEWMLKQHRDRN